MPMERGMCSAVVTSTQVSPGLGWTIACVKTRFSQVSRERLSYWTRAGSTPSWSKMALATSVSGIPGLGKAAEPPLNMSRASG